MADTNTVIEGTVKFRDGKKWKSRWCVMRKLSPVADCLHLQLYRDSKDRYKQGQTKASLSLQHFLGVESGFTLDKESNTIAILCQDVTVVLAFDTRERLIQWQVKIANNLGEDQQFLVQISSAPARAKIAPGPARLHVQEYRFCLTVGVPPRLVGLWDISNLRRYGVVESRFCFEGGSRCGKGEGLYVLVTDQGEEITRTLQLASDGKMGSKRRPVTRNMSVMDSPRKSRPETRMSHVSCADTMSLQQPLLQDSSLHHHQQHCCGCHQASAEDLHGWPSSETRPDSCDYGDTASVGDFTDPHLQPDCANWVPEAGLGRCASCISKLGAMSRSSTAANTPATGFSPAWIMETSSVSLKCGQAACSTASVSSHDSSSGQSDYSVPRLTTTDSWSIRGVSPSSQVERCHCCPPSRPPKPAQLAASPGRKKPPPLPPPFEQTVCSCTCSHSIHRPQQGAVSNPAPVVAYENYDVPKNFVVQSNEGKSAISPNNRVSSCSSEEYYDTPKSIKENIIDTQYGNYDTPPSAVAVRQPCACKPQVHHCTRIVLDTDTCSGNVACPCQRVMCWPSTWLSLPYCRRGNGIENTSVHLHKVKLDGEGKMPVMNTSGEVAVYATIDISKKAKYRLQSEENKESKPNPSESATVNVNDPYTEENFSLNYVNLDLSKQDAEPKTGEGMNYVNLDFAQSLEYYENARDVLQRAGLNQEDDKTDNQLYIVDKNGVKICNKCGHACNLSENKPGNDNLDDYLMMGPGTGSQPQSKPLPGNHKFPGYLPMHPIPSSGNMVKPDLLKARLNRSFGLTDRAASIPSLTGPVVDRFRKRSDSEYQRVPGSAMLGINHSVSATTSPYLRRHPMGAANCQKIDVEQPMRKRSSSADSTRHLDDLESITERTTSTASSTQVNESSINTSVDSLSSQILKKLPPEGEQAIPQQPLGEAPMAEFDSEKDESLRSMVHECLSGHDSAAVHVRRSSSVPCKSGNRDSSSSNDSGVSTGSLKHRGADFAEFELPLTTALSSKRHYHAINQRLHSSQDCIHATLPRRSKSSDPLRELTFQFPKVTVPAKSSSAEAELPICPNKREPKDYSSPSGDGALAVPYIDSRSTSSGTSDMSDYIETLSLSSHSSSDTPDSLRLGRIAATTLRPRSGKEYHKIDRYILESDIKVKGLCTGISTVPEKSESPSPGYVSSSPAN